MQSSYGSFCHVSFTTKDEVIFDVTQKNKHNIKPDKTLKMTITLKEQQPMLKGIITSERSTKGTRLCILLDLQSTRKQDKLVWTLVSQGNTKHSVSLPCLSLSAILGPFLLHVFLKTQPRDTAHILP